MKTAYMLVNKPVIMINALRLNRYYFLLILLFITANISIAQPVPAALPNVIPPSPEAQSFMRYGEIPVDKSTGVPDTQIPLYQITSGKLSLPLSITYHSSGIKVSDIASVAGLGWRLSAGGVLTKSVVGKPDNSPSYGMFGYPYLTKSQIDALPQDGSKWLQLKFIADGTYDGESDRYYYSVGDKLSGTFIYDNSLNIVSETYTENKIIGLNSSDGYGPTAYEVIGEDGTKYFFEATEQSRTDLDPQYVSSWWLTRIVSADNVDTITFEYQTYNSPTVVFTQSQSLTFDGKSSPVSFGGSQTNTLPLLLKKITFKSGYVSFDYINDRKDLQDNRLATVSIYSNASANPLKKYQFSHSYFNSGGDDKYNYRLRLDQLSVYDSALQNIQHYSFEYDNQHNMPQYTEPAVFYNNPSCYAQDLFGYFNGVQSNQHLVTGFYPQAWVTPANRDPDYNYAKTCILTKISYPTGGWTSFEYQLNDAQRGSTLIQGGLRIHRILSYANAASKAIIKRFEYANNLLFIDFDQVGRNVYDWEPIVYIHGGDGTCLYTVSNYTTYTTSSLLPFANFQGSPALYQNVDEYDDDEVSNINLKKSYTYIADNDQIISINSNRYQNQYYMESPWKKGQLQYLIYYKYDALSGYLPKKIETYDYTDLRVNTVIAGTKVERIHPIISNGCFNDVRSNGSTYQTYFTYFDVPIQVGIRKLSKVSILDNMDNNNNGTATTQTTSFDSPYHLFPTVQTSTTSRGEIHRTELTYPQDYAGASVYDQMIARNLINLVIEKRNYKTVNNTNTFLYSSKTNYGFWDGAAWSNSTTDIIVPKLIENQKANYSSEPRVTFNSYNGEGNVQSVSKVNGPQVCYIYGYSGEYPIAKIDNTDYATVQSVLGGQAAIENFRAIAVPTDAIVNSFLAPLRNIANAQVTTYTYTPLVGMTSATDAKGMTAYYEYDSFQRLVNIKDQYGNIVKNYCYNYAGQNIGCSVPVAAYLSDLQSVPFTKNNCGSGLGSTVNYVVPLHAYSSTISVGDANQKAINDVAANGQNYANTHGTCNAPCVGNAYKMINGNCEQGQQVFTSSVHQDDYWRCTYHYQWSDGSTSSDYTVKSQAQCAIAD